MKLNKKTAGLILSGLFLISVAGCDSKKEDTPAATTPAATTPAATTPAATTPAATTPAATTPAATTPAAATHAAPAKGMDTNHTKGKPVITGDAPAPAKTN
jgi:beta-mannanase